MKKIIFLLALIFSTNLIAQQSNDSLCVTNITHRYDSINHIYKLEVSIAYNGTKNHCICGYPLIDFIIDDKGDTIAQGGAMWYFGHLNGIEQDYPISTKLTSLPSDLKCTVYFSNNTFPNDVLLSYPCNNAIGILESDLSEAVVFPNPFVNSTTISASTSFSNATLTVFDMLGNKVKQLQNLSGKTITIERENLPSGIYFYQLTEDNKLVVKGKLLAE
jgi:hypothetical protein